ncbi:HAD-IC family P-type ATPase [Erysipelothrix sp. HDW6A]|uniref:HAD-IC family P-type ATPase n=1 Tax=Erysipelothrix sp. HDW6A TaxID=2714928 RepID=UPI00140D056D|nr:HAD-IC family P-type ATPase [Erysipelothrix sp. HDW6A]QIK57387.1 HAD-IC family P-type ATPase [Erysipelothrix sp. HDW6A]
MKTDVKGLTTAQVQEQVQIGNTNYVPKPKSKSSLQIILGHTFNLFNLYNVIIAFFLIYVKEYLSIFFLNVIVMNIGIRSFQEIRAKKTVENLTILISQDTKVLRNGEFTTIASEDIVLGDVVLYQTGDQISADSLVLTDVIEVNESNLTGESEPVIKYPGDSLLSGSFVTSGSCLARTERVGTQSFAQKITDEARNYEPVESELMNIFLKITRICTTVVLPIGIILVYQSMGLRGNTFHETVLKTSTVLLSLLPKGLVLLTSLSFGVSVYRLAKKRTLVQEIYSIEVLSKVDVMCIDKTGTLTQGEMKVKDVIYLDEEKNAKKDIAAYLGNSKDVDSTSLAMKAYFDIDTIKTPQNIVPFSSVRKWGSMSFEGLGTIYIGAPEFLIQGYELPRQARHYQDEGARLLLVAKTDDAVFEPIVPNTIRALAIIVISDTIRLDVIPTLNFFKNNEVNVKVISGDNINTLRAVASQTGVVNGDKAIDISEMTSDEDLEYAVLNYNVIGRASPHQKQRMVKLLQKNGERVAMVGDGVNDVLALRSADCSIAMGAGSGAARQAAQIILLDNEFKTMVDVVMEGRLVTNNISRSASMYYLGTLLTFMLSIVSIILNTPYPFAPLQVSVMSMFAEGMPSSFVTFENDYSKPKDDVLPNILRNILPNATAMAIMFVGILSLKMDLKTSYTMMYFVTTYLSFALVYFAFKPMNWKRIGVLLAAASSFVTVCFIFYEQLYLVLLNPREIQITVVLIVISTGVLLLLKKFYAYAVTVFFNRRMRRKKKKQ